ncbi:MAG TPA: tRNA pseudouridine(38-40) synthase TruA [Pyrinomonadaceae bacterium]|jgi:tRNA pseudouridine38-40 synthase|nr:tRNA pseudouridine(38-40) synthase TruA [Pyrinomonadaceae bacterium]
MNYKLTIQYDGTEFHGWQVQGAGERTVQGELARVLTLLDGGEVAVHGAGRTDAGVHAEAQVASVHLRREFTGEKLRAALNGNLARDVRVIAAEIVPDDFHARFSAQGKTYCYRIFNARVLSPFWARYALHEGRAIETRLMQQHAEHFVGEHDWTAFSCAQTDALTRVRRVTLVEVSEHWSARGRGRLIEIRVSGEGFLRYMVRSIAGTLVAAGRGEVDAARIQTALRTGDRSLAAPTAPAHGLTLVEVHYENSDE